MATENPEYRSPKPCTGHQKYRPKNRGAKDELFRAYLQDGGQQDGEKSDDGGKYGGKPSKREAEKGMVR